ncbi:MAG: hypothetical protein ACJ8GN_23125 [Longimicrobiaceae bacterium]
MADDKQKHQRLNAPDEHAAKAALKAAAQPGGSQFGVEDCCVREFWAVVETDGTLVRGRNVWRTAHLGQGIYEVIFTGDVSQGVYSATIGRPGIATEPAGMVSVALRCCLSSPEDNKGVWVDTHDPGGAFSDRAFHLVVHV